MTAGLFDRYSDVNRPEYLPDTCVAEDVGTARQYLDGDDECATPAWFGVDDGDGEDFVDIAVRGAVARELLQQDGFGHVGELWDRDDAGIEYQARTRPTRPAIEVCSLCAWPLNLPRPWRSCEFDRSPGVWWRVDSPAWCHCGGCLCAPTRRNGRPESYCSDGCRWRMKLARERARRRAEGAVSRAFDDEADRRADYETAIRKREAQRIASDHYPRW